MKYFSSLFVLLLLVSPVNAQKVSVDLIREYFPEYKITQLHLHPSLTKHSAMELKNQSFDGKEISGDDFERLNIAHSDSSSYYAICQILLNDNIALLIVTKEVLSGQKDILGYKYNRQNEKIEDKFVLAQYRFLKDAYKSITNSWLRDFDGDDDTDLIIRTDLQDFELPTEDSENISNTQTIYYKCQDDSLTYEWVPPISMDLNMKK